MRHRLNGDDLSEDLRLGRLDRLDGVGTRHLDVSQAEDPGTAAYLGLLESQPIQQAMREFEIAQAEVAQRAEQSGLTVGQIQDHLQHMVELATSVEGHNFESLPQIGEAILVLQADLGEQLDEAHP